jgi:hypothetical protein
MSFGGHVSLRESRHPEVAPQNPSAAFRLDQARESYGQVLDATKHQDDKIGRFLTAIAFLFTGAIAFGTRSDLVTVQYQLDGHVLPLPGILLGLFSVMAVISVLFLLIALGPNLKLPRPERGTSEEGRGRQPSRIYFFSISDLTLEEWELLWKYPNPSSGDMFHHYIVETHNLATKTDFKYSRTNEARALFTLGLLFLALSVALGFGSLTDFTSQPPVVLSWNGSTRLLVAAIAGVFSFALVYDQWRLEQELDSRLEPEEHRQRLLPLGLLLFAAPTFVVSLLLPDAKASVWITLPPIAALGLTSVAFVLQAGPSWGRGWPWILCGLVIGIGGYATSVEFLLNDLYLPRLTLAGLAILALEMPRLINAHLLWRRRRRSHPSLDAAKSDV